MMKSSFELVAGISFEAEVMIILSFVERVSFMFIAKNVLKW